MGLRCKRCGGEEQVKNGFMRGKQRYRCKACGLNFTDTPARGMPLRVKVTAVLLYLSGLSMNRTAKLLGVSTPSVMAWIEQFAEAYAQKPEPEGRAVGNCSPRDGAGAEGLTSGTVTGSAPAAPYPRPNRAATRASAASTVKASGSKSSPSISSHSWRRGCAGSPRTASSCR